ncbi:MAG: hypothetical protein QM765_00295 [Myxococcales bacterium]
MASGRTSGSRIRQGPEERGAGGSAHPLERVERRDLERLVRGRLHHGGGVGRLAGDPQHAHRALDGQRAAGLEHLAGERGDLGGGLGGGPDGLGEALHAALAEALGLERQGLEGGLAGALGRVAQPLGDQLDRAAPGHHAQQAQHGAAQVLVLGQRGEHGDRWRLADAPERVQRRQLQHPVALGDGVLERGDRRVAADLAQGLGGGVADVAVGVGERRHQRRDGGGVADLAEHVGGELAHVAVGVLELGHQRAAGRPANQRERLGGGVARPGVVGVGQPQQQALDGGPGIGVLDDLLDRGLAHAPALVGEALEEHAEVARRVERSDRPVADLRVGVLQAGGSGGGLIHGVVLARAGHGRARGLRRPARSPRIRAEP